MKITAVLAMDENFLIGVKDNNALPWHIPEDLKRFQKLTTGGIVLMGRNTYFSLPEKFRPLPNRRNIVVTRQLIEGVECYSSIDELIDTMSKEKAEILFLIGGASLYDQFFEKGLIDRVELTLVTGTHKGKDSDIFVKEFRHNFHEIKSEDFNSGKFITLEKN